jgi:hypothetical protein
MPTPRPIIVASDGPLSLTAYPAASSLTRPRPVTIPSAAVAIGMNAAMTEPNANSNTTIAAPMPTFSPSPLRGDAKSATSSPDGYAATAGAGSARTAALSADRSRDSESPGSPNRSWS